MNLLYKDTKCTIGLANIYKNAQQDVQYNNL